LALVVIIHASWSLETWAKYAAAMTMQAAPFGWSIQHDQQEN
jgi:hypothetical protein